MQFNYDYHRDGSPYNQKNGSKAISGGGGWGNLRIIAARGDCIPGEQARLPVPTQDFPVPGEKSLLRALESPLNFTGIWAGEAVTPMKGETCRGSSGAIVAN